MDVGQCPQCGGQLIPVLERPSASGLDGPLLADSPVRVHCPTCRDSLDEVRRPDGPHPVRRPVD